MMEMTTNCNCNCNCSTLETETTSKSDTTTTFPTTYVTADTSSFKKVVQDLTSLPPRSSTIPAMKTKKKEFKLSQRPNRVLMVNPLAAARTTPEMAEPPTTPATSLSVAGEEEKSFGLYMYPSPRESEPTLLPLFPVTSPDEQPRNPVE